MTHTPHLIPLPHYPNQALWRWFCVRSAGFPAHEVLALAVTPATLALATAYRQAQSDYEQLEARAISTLQTLMSQTPPPERKPLQKALQHLKQHRVPTFINLPILSQLEPAYQHKTQLAQQYDQAMIQEGQRLNETFRAIFQQPRLQEALIWQNRQTFHNGGWLGGFLKQSPTETHRSMRDRECLLINYLQRYCLKNDTIGFFGPVGWGQFDTSEMTLNYHHGAQLLTNRQLYFEHWGIAALANSLNQRPALRPYCCPRSLPIFYIEHNTVHLPMIAALLRTGQLPPLIQSHFPISPIEQQILTWCNGQHTAQAIAAQANSLFQVAPEDCYEWLNQWVKWGILEWGLAIPLTLTPVENLRQQLTLITDSALQEQALTPLNQLNNLTQAVQHAIGQPQALHDTLATLETHFSQLTQQAATHKAGEYYGGRNLLYEECRRDLSLTLGQDFIQALSSPLGLLLTSVRWFTYRIATLYKAALTEIYQKLTVKLGTHIIDFYTFSSQITSLLQDAHNPLLRQATEELRQKWAALLHWPTDLSTSELHYQGADLSEAVQQTFQAPHSGWSWARYCCPDVLVAASEPTAIDQGDYSLILGELHLFNNLGRTLFSSQHPDPTELAQARQADIPQPCVIPIPSAQSNTQRNAFTLTSPNDIWFAYDNSPAPYPLSDTVTLGELVVVHTDHGLQVQTRDGRHSFEIIEFLGYTLSNLCLNFPSIAPTSSHVPRISFDKLVISRERWNFPIAEVTWAEILTRPEQFLAAQQWQHTHHLPRFIFVVIPTEPKPFFVDFHNPLLLDVLARAVRGASKSQPSSTMQMSEMYPNFDQLWLTDSPGSSLHQRITLSHYFWSA